VRFDDTEIPGLRSTVAYVDAQSVPPGKLANLISEKLGPRVHEKFLPPEPDKLFAALGATSLKERHAVESISVSFMQTLMRMTVDERRLIAHVFREACHTQLPDNVHISLDIIRRDLGMAPSAVIESLRAMTSLGFEGEAKPDDDHADEMLFVRWIDTMNYKDEFINEFSDDRATEVASSMVIIGMGDEGCKQCADQCVESLDFSLLASPTSKSSSHG
jgi:hypothetical protein